MLATNGPVVYLCKFHVKRSQQALLACKVFLQFGQLTYLELVLCQVWELLENFTIRSEINQLQ